MTKVLCAIIHIARVDVTFSQLIALSFWNEYNTSETQCAMPHGCFFCPSLQSYVTLFASGDLQVMTIVAALLPERRSLQRDELSLMLRWQQNKERSPLLVEVDVSESVSVQGDGEGEGITLRQENAIEVGLVVWRSVRILLHLLIVLSFCCFLSLHLHSPDFFTRCWVWELHCRP